MSQRATPPLVWLFSHLLVAAIAAFVGSQWLSPAAPTAPLPAASETAEPALFRVGAREYRYFDLPIEYRRPIYQIRKLAFEQELLLIEEAVVEAYIQQQMQAEQSDRMTVQNRLMPGAAPSEEEVQRFYADNQSQSSPPLEQMRADLVTYLTAAKQEQLKKGLLAKLLIAGDAQMLTEAPQLEPLEISAPKAGNGPQS